METSENGRTEDRKCGCRSGTRAVIFAALVAVAICVSVSLTIGGWPALIATMLALIYTSYLVASLLYVPSKAVLKYFDIRVQQHQRTGPSGIEEVQRQNGARAPDEEIEIVSNSQSRGEAEKGARWERKRRLIITDVVVAIMFLVLLIIAIHAVSAGQDMSGTEPHPYIEFGYGALVFLGLVAFYLVALDLIYGAYCGVFWCWQRCRIPSPEDRKLSSPERKRRIVFLLVKPLAVLLLGVLLTTASFIQGDRRPVTRELSHSFSTFPSAMNELRLVHLSDLHVGPTVGKSNIQSIVNQVNKLNPDVVVITGDLLDGNIDRFREVIQPLRDFRTTRGVYMCTGNHEYRVSLDEVDEWMDELRELNVWPLRNERVTLFAHSNLSYSNVNGVTLFPPSRRLSEADKTLLRSLGLGQSNITWPETRFPAEEMLNHLHSMEGFYLSGIEDYVRRVGSGGVNTDPVLAFGNRLENRTIVGLAHQPLHIPIVAKFQVDLVLSGHTHGGQVWPVHLGTKLANPYFRGLSQHNPRTEIYVSGGTNQWGPRARLGSSREIAVHLLSNVG
eukprot:gb/GECG01013534.1/.p1 GENE.gb/GECG01013534.1/~~gb/GECG01013534.1/.p1  ORF type:complete len:559 (+),score=31.01 gb/GECG01013534.1/:1-1677(+)